MSANTYTHTLHTPTQIQLIQTWIQTHALYMYMYAFMYVQVQIFFDVFSVEQKK